MSIALFALLLVWGGYTLIMYLGVPYHGAALMTDAAMTKVSAACADTAFFCRGLMSLWPIIARTIGRASPFLWYGIISLAVYGIVVCWKWLMLEEKELHIRWKPWKLLLLGIVLMWLMSTVLNYGSVNGNPVRLYVEPSAKSYNVSDQAMISLQNDYQSLRSRGCLAPLGLSEAGTELSMLRGWCIATSFVTRVLSQVLFVLVFLFELLILGRLALYGLLWRAKERRDEPWLGFPSLLVESIFSVAVGAGVGIVILWLFAVAGLYTTMAGWLVALVIPIFGFRHARYWINRFLYHSWEGKYRFWDLSLLLGWLIITYIALNFLVVVRPFPIGWDDLGSYLNRPRLLVSYGFFIHSMAAFDWAYLTSLGFLLFGYDAPFGSTASMMVNWTGGFLAVMAIFAFVKTFLGSRHGHLSSLLYYALPLVGHFSFADMKIDNTVFFFCTVATLALFLALRPAEETQGDQSWPRKDAAMLLFLTGLLLGFGFATKTTAAMAIFALGAVLVGITVHWTAFLGALAFAFAAFSFQGVLSVRRIIERVVGVLPDQTAATIFTSICVAIGLACFGYALYRRRLPWKPLTMLVLSFAGGVCVAVLPWVEHNNIRGGKIIPSFELSAPNTLSPQISVDYLPQELAVDKSSPMCTGTGSIEELDRYWGFGEGFSHFLTLPWRTVMNINATGYYVTTVPALLLFPLLLLLPFFWSKEAWWLRWLTWGTAMMLVEWMFLANGIPWYGISMLFGIAVALEVLAKRAPDRPNRIVAGTLIALSLLIAFGMRLWQMESQRNIFEYGMGKISAESLREITIPHYDDISAMAVERYKTMPDRPHLYRVGTFIPYFIPQNLQVIGTSDHQLDVFNCMYAERDPAKAVARLKALGFNAIIFDTNTATIEQDVNGTLHTKVNAFVEFVNNPASGLQVVISDIGAGVAYILIP